MAEWLGAKTAREYALEKENERLKREVARLQYEAGLQPNINGMIETNPLEVNIGSASVERLELFKTASINCVPAGSQFGYEVIGLYEGSRQKGFSINYYADEILRYEIAHHDAQADLLSRLHERFIAQLAYHFFGREIKGGN